jgi:hypothetical protein
MCHAQFPMEKGIGSVLEGLNLCLLTVWVAKQFHGSSYLVLNDTILVTVLRAVFFFFFF